MCPSRRLVADSISSLPDTSSATLLIALRDRTETVLLKRALEDSGYNVLVARDSRQARRTIYKHRPHLLILDANLRKAGGVQVCEQVKADETLGFVPVILVTEPDPDRHENASIHAADTTILKPIDLDELQGWLRFLLRIKWQFDRLMHENRELSVASRTMDLLKTDIINTVSHELRTPLVQVKASVSLLVEDILQNGSHSQTNVADMAMQAVARLESAVENIRQLAQTHQIRLSPVMISEAADLALRHMERNWISRDARERVEKHIEDDLPPVLSDKRAMARLLQLLLDNALKFSAEDSPVYILAYVLDNDQVWVGVQDFGIGIPAEEHARIFEAFYQVDGSSTRRYGGTGVGLALAMLLAEGMGTAIHLDSAPNEGSTFWFTLPTAKLDEFGGVPGEY